MENISIEKSEQGFFIVRQGDKYSDRLGYDEMLGTISAQTMPENRPCLHLMKTKEEWNACFPNISINKE